jgi:hypothetical protein
VLRQKGRLVLRRRARRGLERSLALPHARLQLAHRRLGHRAQLLHRARVGAARGRAQRGLAAGGEAVERIVVLALQGLELAARDVQLRL